MQQQSPMQAQRINGRVILSRRVINLDTAHIVDEASIANDKAQARARSLGFGEASRKFKRQHTGARTFA